MNETITLGVGGDINLIKSRLLTNPDCVFPVSVIKETEGDKITYFNFEYNEDIKTLDKYLNVLSEYIIDRYEARLLRRIIDENYDHLPQKVKRDILKDVIIFSDDAHLGYNARKSCILMALYDCLREDNKIYLDGFVAFRLKEYEDILKKITEKLFSVYETKKDYDEFIELLKYFVSVQSPRPELLSITAEKNGKYTIKDRNGKDITKKCTEEFSDGFLEKEADCDDILISALIMVAPEKIIIHKPENIKNQDLFLTIKRVFANVVYCTGCDICTDPAKAPEASFPANPLIT